MGGKLGLGFLKEGTVSIEKKGNMCRGGGGGGVEGYGNGIPGTCIKSDTG